MYKEYTVLFVDDDINIQKSIRRLMMDEEFSSVFASSGKEAIDIINRKKISVVVSDMRMPEMNGLELLKIVEEISPITVKLVLTGYTQIPQILATVNQVDIYKFVSKPWEADELIMTIKKSIDYYITKEEYAVQKKILETQNKAYKNILAKINTVVNDSKNNNEIICRCGIKIIEFGTDFNLKKREMFKDVFDIQPKLFEILAHGTTVEKSSISMDTFVKKLSDAVLPIIPEAKICTKTDLAAIINADLKILETAIAAVSLVFSKEFIGYGLVISVENADDFNVVMICPGIKYNEADDDNIKTIIDVKAEFVSSFLRELFRFSEVQFSQLDMKDAFIIKYSISSEKQENK